MKRPWPALAVAAVLAGACGGQPWPQDLAPVAHPGLAGVEEVARRQLEEQRAALSGLLDRGRGEPRELAEAFGHMGRLYHAYELLAPAAACYENARTLDPESFLWPYYLGLAAQAEGRLEDARGHFARALELGPGNAPARLRLGEVLLGLNEPREARAAFEPLVDDERYAAAARTGLGRVELAAGDPQRAVAHLRAVLELEPQAGSVHNALGTALRRLGRHDEAREHFERKSSGEVVFDDPLKERLEALAVSSGSYLRRANQALMAGRLDEAIAEYRRAVEVDPENAAARRNLALALGRTGAADAAARQLRAALESAPEDPQLHFDLGNAVLAQGDREAAVAAFRRALELAPDLQAARFNLANVLAGLDRWEEAYRHLEEFLASEPGDSRARYLAAMALHRQGRSDEALGRLHALLDDEPGNGVARQGLATVYAALGQTERALEIHRETLDLDLPADDKVAILNQLAELSWRHGRQREAVSYFRRAVELAPRSSDAHTRLANALQLAGERAEAAELFARAVELDPKNATAWLSEASLRILAGEHSRAVERLDLALAEVPEHAGLNHILARLLATSPDPALRDGQRALALARKAQGRESSLEHAATVAMALAELGRFEEAVRWQQELIRQAAAAGAEPALIRRLVAHLRSYESGQPVRFEASP